MTTVQLIHLGASALLLMAAFAVLSYRFRLRKAHQPSPLATSDLVDALERRLETQFKAQAALIGDQNKKMAKIASQVTTLADERLVEQAISIARMGGDPEQISTSVGLTLDEATALHRYRQN